MSSELRPWLHPGLSRLWGGWCGCHSACTWPKRVGEQSIQRFPWGALCRDLSKNPGNDVTSWQQNPTEPGTWVSRPPQRRGAPSQIACCQDVLLFAPAQRLGPRESSQAECVGTCSTLVQASPERALSLCPKEKEGNIGAPGQARSPLPSHPGNPESFPCVHGWGFLGVCLPQASPGGCGSEACGPVVSTPQGRAG